MKSNSSRQFALVIICSVLILAGCGGETSKIENLDAQRMEVVNQDELPPEDFTTMNSYADSRTELLKTLADEGSIPPKPIDVSGRKYVDILVENQIREAYSREGEYIDPRLVREMLHGEDATGSEAEDADTEIQQDTVKTWRISYEIHDKALEKYKAGDIAAAASLWQGLPAIKRSFTISIEIDCDRDKLTASFQTVQGLEMPVFILPQTIKAKGCYRLCAGIFESLDETNEYIAKIKEQLPDTYPFAMSFLTK